MSNSEIFNELRKLRCQLDTLEAQANVAAMRGQGAHACDAHACDSPVFEELAAMAVQQPLPGGMAQERDGDSSDGNAAAEDLSPGQGNESDALSASWTQRFAAGQEEGRLASCLEARIAEVVRGHLARICALGLQIVVGVGQKDSSINFVEQVHGKVVAAVDDLRLELLHFLIDCVSVHLRRMELLHNLKAGSLDIKKLLPQV